MATGLQVFHIEKRLSITNGLNRHITRKQFVCDGDENRVEVWVPNNADPSRTPGNVELVSRESINPDGQKIELTLQQAVDRRLREAEVKPRKGQSTCMEIIFSGSSDVMNAMSRDELLNWAVDTVAWARETWGKDNVVSASLHVDELTPHIHMVVVPIVTGQSRRTKNHKQNKSSRTYNIDHNKLRLCVNEVYTQPKLYEYHDSYAEKVSEKYGLSRGVKAKPGSKKNHTSSIEFNRRLAVQAKEAESLIFALQSDYVKKTEEVSAATKRQKERYDHNQEVLKKQGAKIAENDAILENQERKKSEDFDGTMAALGQKAKESAGLKDKPKKNILGAYNASEMDSFLEKLNSGKIVADSIPEIQRLRGENNKLKRDNGILERENTDLKREYKDFYNSPKRLKERLEELQDLANRQKVQDTIEYVLERKVSSVHSYTFEGQEVFATFRLSDSPSIFSVHITASEEFSYTDNERVTSLQKARELSRERIWWNKGRISEIRQKREEEKANATLRRGRGIHG